MTENYRCPVCSETFSDAVQFARHVVYSHPHGAARGCRPAEIFADPAQHPNLSVPQSAVIRAVRNLDKVEALALIRQAYRHPDGGAASLDEAKEIYTSIQARA